MTVTHTQIVTSISAYLQRAGVPSFSPRAALIDMDGTLYDSMPHHCRAWERMVTELGIPCDYNEFFNYEGMTGAATIDLLIRRAWNRPATETEKVELYKRKTQYFNELPTVIAMPGAARMLAVLRENDIERVLVTGSAQHSILDRLNAEFPGAFRPGMRVTALDVTNGKPHPEPYLRGIELAGVKPHESIVIENAPLGVRAGHDSGAFTVAVTTGPIPVENMTEAGADLVVSSMEEFADILPQLLKSNV